MAPKKWLPDSTLVVLPTATFFVGAGLCLKGVLSVCVLGGGGFWDPQCCVPKGPKVVYLQQFPFFPTLVRGRGKECLERP